MKILNSKSKNFDKLLENLLLQRKKKIENKLKKIGIKIKRLKQ